MKTEKQNKKTTAKKQDAQKANQKGFLRELAELMLFVVPVMLLFRTLLYDPFNIPSESMLPNLMTGDYIFVSKMSYGYSKHSTPFFTLDLFDGRVLEDQPERGDIAVFKWPGDNETDYIKRVIGLPGDTVQMVDGVLYLNGEQVRKERIDDFVFEESPNMNCFKNPQFRRVVDAETVECHYPQYRETLPSGVSYTVLDLNKYGDSDNTRLYRVPEGHYFMMGDNRDNSADSRKTISVRGVSYVPAENLVGRATLIFWSTNGEARLWEFWGWPGTVRGNRILKGLQAE